MTIPINTIADIRARASSSASVGSSLRLVPSMPAALFSELAIKIDLLQEIDFDNLEALSQPHFEAGDDLTCLRAAVSRRDAPLRAEANGQPFAAQFEAAMG